MKILLTLLLVAMPLANLSARKVHTENTVMEVKPDTLMVITQLYLQRLDSLGRERDSLNTIVPQLVPNGYYAHVLTTPTLFSSVLAQMMSGVDSAKVAGDSQLRRAYAGNVALARMYVQAPWLVTQTEATIKQQGHLVHQGGLAVVHVGDNGYISQFFVLQRKNPFLLGIKIHALCGAPRKQANSSVHEVLCIIPGCPEGAREWHILFFAMLLHSKSLNLHIISPDFSDCKNFL